MRLVRRLMARQFGPMIFVSFVVMLLAAFSVDVKFGHTALGASVIIGAGTGAAGCAIIAQTMTEDRVRPVVLRLFSALTAVIAVTVTAALASTQATDRTAYSVSVVVTFVVGFIALALVQLREVPNATADHNDDINDGGLCMPEPRRGTSDADTPDNVQTL